MIIYLLHLTHYECGERMGTAVIPYTSLEAAKQDYFREKKAVENKRTEIVATIDIWQSVGNNRFKMQDEIVTIRE